MRSYAVCTGGKRQLLGSIVVTLISVGMLIGSFLLSQLDTSDVQATPTQAGAVSIPSPVPFLPTLTSAPWVTASPSPSLPATGTAVSPALTPSPSPTSSMPLIPTCPQPPGWFVYTVRQGDTLTSLAYQAGITALALKDANCLSVLAVQPGQQVYLPPAFYASPTPWACGPPLGWVVYIVRPGDTLYSLSLRFGVGIDAIRRANCLPDYTIRVGGALYLPPLPPAPTQVVPTSTPTPQSTPPSTGTPVSTPTSTYVPTSTPTPALTQLPTATASPVPTGYPTPTPTPILTGTVVHTPTYTPTPTDTPAPTATSTLTPTPTPTALPTSTYTPTSTPTMRPTSTYTPAPTSTSISSG